jgi:regulator of sirC expression with transglutaminase-like and TPR domain
MTVARPHYCLENAYDLFAAQLQNLEADGALLRATVAISMHEMPHVNYVEVEDRLQGLANRVLSRVSSDNPKALLAHAHAVLFDEEKFVGNVENYYDPANSYIPEVLDNKCGIPITLCLIYKEVLERVGLHVVGTNSPGHFLASVWIDGNPMIVDPFTRGRVLSRAEARDRIADLVGDIDEDKNLFQPATSLGWLGRILQNLLVVFGQSRQQASLAAMLELQALLARADEEK